MEQRQDASVAYFTPDPSTEFEVRALGDGMEFTGYAAVFDSPSEDLGGFRESIKPGAFTRSLNAAKNGGRDIKAFLNHADTVVLGSTRAKTLRLAEDTRGLVAEITLPDNEWGRPVRDAVRRGDISAMSFGFTVPAKGDSWNDSRTERTLHEVRLFEVSPVTGWPAYASTSASVRSILDATAEEDAQRIADDLTDEQATVLLRVLNRRSTSPLITPTVAGLLARLEAKKRAA